MLYFTAESRLLTRHGMSRYALETIVVLLILLWLLGAFVVPVGSDLIHLLLVVVLVVVVIRLFQGRALLR